MTAETAELVVYGHTIAPEIVLEPLRGDGIAFRTNFATRPAAIDTLIVVLQPRVKGFSPDTPVTVQRILDPDPADPAPAPIIAVPVYVVFTCRIIATLFIKVVNIPSAVGQSAASGHINQGLVVEEGNTKTSPKRAHEIDFSALRPALFEVCFCGLRGVAISTIDECVFMVGARQAGEVRLDAE